jgi:ubiquinone/menaquinone biosynthesis C-methylase UbiE
MGLVQLISGAFWFVFSSSHASVSQMHGRAIVDQFSKQAVGFAAGTPLRSPEGLDKIVKLAKLATGESVLDLGSGPGIVSCAFGKAGAARVLGIDATPRMLEQAKQEAQMQGLASKVSFQQGDIYATGLADGSFDVVVSRFVLHHLERPAEALREMRRVARRRVVLADVTPDAACADALNSLEKLRDNSHVAFYPQSVLTEMIKAAGLHVAKAESYRVDSFLSEWLARSFFASAEDKAEFVRRIFHDMEKNDSRGLDLRLSKKHGDVIWSHMVSVLAADVRQ